MTASECGANPWDGDGIDSVRPECVHPEHWLSVPVDRNGWLDYDDAPALCRWAQVHQYCDLDAWVTMDLTTWPGLKQLVPVLDHDEPDDEPPNKCSGCDGTGANDDHENPGERVTCDVCWGEGDEEWHKANMQYQSYIADLADAASY